MLVIPESRSDIRTFVGMDVEANIGTADGPTGVSQERRVSPVTFFGNY